MRVLIDECLDYRLFREFSEHEVKSVAYMGWAGFPDQEILRLAQYHFEVVITKDRNFPYQQNMKKSPLGLIVLRIRQQDSPKYFKSLAPQIKQAIQNIQPGDVVFIP